MPSLSVSAPQVLAALREMPPTRILSLRQQTQLLWDAYFSSIEKVIYTTLEVGLHLWGAWPLPSTSYPFPLHTPLRTPSRFGFGPPPLKDFQVKPEAQL